MLKKKPLKDTYRYVLDSVKNKAVTKEDGQYVRRSICGKANDYKAKEAAKFLKMFKMNMAKAFSSKIKPNRFNRAMTIVAPGMTRQESVKAAIQKSRENLLRNSDVGQKALLNPLASAGPDNSNFFGIASNMESKD